MSRKTKKKVPLPYDSRLWPATYWRIPKMSWAPRCQCGRLTCSECHAGAAAKLEAQ
jgi:hypothetical protein